MNFKLRQIILDNSFLPTLVPFSRIQSLEVGGGLLKSCFVKFQKLLWKTTVMDTFVYVYVCVCVFIFFHRKDLFRQQRCLGHTSGYGSTILSSDYYSQCFCQIPLSPFLKMSYITSKDETPASWKTEEKTIWYIAPAKRWYIQLTPGYSNTV